MARRRAVPASRHAPGDVVRFSKSGSLVELVSRLPCGDWSVRRADTGKGMQCPDRALVPEAEWPSAGD